MTCFAWFALACVAYYAALLWDAGRAHARRYAADIAAQQRAAQAARKARERASNARAWRWLRRCWPCYVGMLACEALYLVWRLH